MKKFIKSLSLICLAVLMVCPLMLAGCARNYNITIEIAAGQGVVLEKGYDQAKTVVGKNTVKQGDRFEFLVKPTTGYQIAKIEIDGAEYTESYEKGEDGTYLSFEDVDKNHNVKITFEAIDRFVRFECQGAGGTYEIYNRTISNASGVILLNGYATVKHGQTLDLATNFAYGTEAGKVEWVLYTGTSTTAAAAQIAVNSNLILRTELTAAQLDAIFGL